MSNEKYPQHEKVKLIKHESQAVHEFLNWLQEDKALRISTSESDRRGNYVPWMGRQDELVAEYFGIDLKAFSKEKDAMYEEMTSELNKRKGGA